MAVIDAAGCRGLRKVPIVGKTLQFSDHEGQATKDLEQLGEEVRDRVKQHSGIELRWEIRRIGKHPQMQMKESTMSYDRVLP